jgi:hypothetical protein
MYMTATGLALPNPAVDKTFRQIITEAYPQYLQLNGWQREEQLGQEHLMFIHAKEGY